MKQAARRIVEMLRLHVHEAFFAGGWVRDTLLRRKSKDIDIATSAHPTEVLRLFPKSTPIGSQFGVVQVLMYRRAYEVATFRGEAGYEDGRHPTKVDFVGPERDALRRDFTVNGMFYDPIAERVIDYVRGRTDIKKRILRSIGRAEERFSEDRLRMLRAVRLACDLDFTIDSKTWQAICRISPGILEISWERIRGELLQIITGRRSGRGVDLLLDSGLLARILPEVEAMHDVPQPEEFHPEGDVLTHTRMALELLRKPSPVLALATLLHDVGKPSTFSIQERIRFDGHVERGAELSAQVCRRLKLSNAEKQQVVDLVANHLRFVHVKEMRPSTLKRFLRKSNFLDHLELHRADCLSSHGDLENYEYCRKMLDELKQEQISPPVLLTGRDLIELGFKPGPIFRQILQVVETMQLEGSLLTKLDAMEYVRSSYPTPPGKQMGKS